MNLSNGFFFNAKWGRPSLPPRAFLSNEGQ